MFDGISIIYQDVKKEKNAGFYEYVVAIITGHILGYIN